MRPVTIVAATTAFAASALLLGSCQHYDAEPVVPLAIGAKMEPHLIQGARMPPHIMMVVDRSGSMNESAGTGFTTKLGDVKDKFASDSGFLAQSGGGAEFGLILFASGTVCNPGTITDPVGTDVAQIRQRINGATPGGGTPTAASLAQVLQDPKMNTPEDGRSRFVMLLTDGAPNCNPGIPADDPSKCRSTGSSCNPPSECCLDDVATIDQVTALAQQGIQTFVIGFGKDTGNSNSLAYEVLNNAAVAGGLAKGQDPKFYQANNGDELAKALAAFGAVIQSCNYSLTAVPKDSMLEVVFVYTKDGNREEPLASGDWTYNASTRAITITGSRCTEIEKGTEGLNVEFRYVTSL